MIRDEIRVGVTNLAINEREHAIEEYGYFHSDHEAYSVTLEEVEEAQDELERINWKMANIWDDVKHDRPLADEIHTMRDAAINCACECIQVAAMCDKYLTPKDK